MLLFKIEKFKAEREIYSIFLILKVDNSIFLKHLFLK